MKEEAERKFGFLMYAIKYSAPPQGGIVLRFDRMVMIFSGEISIRGTIALPKITSAISLMDNSPPAESEEQLMELHIKTREEQNSFIFYKKVRAVKIILQPKLG